MASSVQLDPQDGVQIRSGLNGGECFRWRTGRVQPSMIAKSVICGRSVAGLIENQLCAPVGVDAVDSGIVGLPVVVAIFACVSLGLAMPSS